jgi:hypothetical protein
MGLPARVVVVGLGGAVVVVTSTVVVVAGPVVVGVGAAVVVGAGTVVIDVKVDVVVASPASVPHAAAINASRAIRTGVALLISLRRTRTRIWVTGHFSLFAHRWRR